MPGIEYRLKYDNGAHYTTRGQRRDRERADQGAFSSTYE